MATVARLLIHPVKSLDGQPVAEARLLASGAIAHDRAYAIVDASGNFVNAKRHAAIHRLRSHIDIDAELLTLRDESDRGLETATFHLRDDRAPLAEWLSAFFGLAVSLEEDRVTGFPDDLVSPGPTIISTATLAEIAAWFELSLDEVHARFRANIEIDGVPAFWEDQLFGPDGEAVAFAIGAQRFLGINPCQRCVVPTRDPRTGRLDPAFSRRFVERRRATLPSWSPRERFDHFYRAAINTRLDRAAPPGTVRIGDAVALDDPPGRVVVAAEDGIA